MALSARMSSEHPPSGEAAPRVLVADADPEACEIWTRALRLEGMEVALASDVHELRQRLADDGFDVALVDLALPGGGGLDVLRSARSSDTTTELVIVAADGDVETAVRAVRSGAHDFLRKPMRSSEEVALSVIKATEKRRLVRRARWMERRLQQIDRFGELIGNSEAMRAIYRLAMGVAPTSSTVLLLGESGTGKELTARAVHQHSQRADGPFVAVNCSAIPVELVESELFGHVRGAFTGATGTRAGLFEAAHGGTLFLDEVGDLPTSAQVKLLRALQHGEVKRVGSDETRHVDVRVVAATNNDLRKAIAEGRFREDLFYRLNVVAISLPPLRERRDDIPLLAVHFLQRYSSRANRPTLRLGADAVRVLTAHDWPGNVRELENAMEHAVVFCIGDTVGPADLPEEVRGLGPRAADRLEVAKGLTLPATLLDLPFRDAKVQATLAFEAVYFATLLARHDGNVSRAARASGLDRSNFRRAARRAGVGRGGGGFGSGG